MSNVPLPEPDFVQVHKPAFYKDIPIRLDWWSATSMHAHAAAVSAAVSAAKDAEIECLRERVRVLEDALADLLSLYDQRIPLRERPTTWEAARAALAARKGTT